MIPVFILENFFDFFFFLFSSLALSLIYTMDILWNSHCEIYARTERTEKSLNFPEMFLTVFLNFPLPYQFCSVSLIYIISCFCMYKKYIIFFVWVCSHRFASSAVSLRSFHRLTSNCEVLWAIFTRLNFFFKWRRIKRKNQLEKNGRRQSKEGKGPNVLR